MALNEKWTIRLTNGESTTITAPAGYSTLQALQYGGIMLRDVQRVESKELTR